MKILSFSAGHEFTEELAKRDGFKSAEDFFDFFDRRYDLSTPKKFAVYRFRWD